MRAWLVLLIALWALPAAALENRLADHPSPYLAMHGHDPVAWQEWSPAVLELARREGKPIYLSSGYFSCYWCHVMHRESYSDPEIAAFLNAHFIPVKVDRELNPALDAYLIDYLERTRGRAGWPLNVFLTPEGYPLVGMTYQPPKAFLGVLKRLAAAWEANPDELRDLARRALLELTAEPVGEGSATAPGPELLRRRFLNQVLAYAEPMAGGFGEQNKFPMTPQLRAVLALSGGGRSEDLDDWLRLTLDKMASEGLRDHLAGGFFRYTVDPSWQVPHFEKMLYTQAQLVRVYLGAAARFRRPEWAKIAAETLDFVLRRMRGPQGLYIASLSAVDEGGEEGGSYLWTPEQLEKALGKEDAALARRRWRMQGHPQAEGGFLPRQGESIAALAKAEGVSEEKMRRRLADIRARLLAARERRAPPADTKELAGWNGLLIGALADAGRQLQRDDYLDEAQRLARRLRELLWHDGGLWRAASDGRPVGSASLADYAYLAEGLGRLLQARPDPGLRTWRDALLAEAWRRFHGPRGFRQSEKLPLPGMGESPVLQDGALPAGPAMLIQASLAAGGTPAAAARSALAEALPYLQDEPFWYASWVAAAMVDRNDVDRASSE